MRAPTEFKQLEGLCEVFADGDWIETKDQAPNGIRLVQTGNVGNGEFKDRDEKARFVSEATFKRLRCTEIFEGDCLISRLPDPVGRSCILPATDRRMITAVDCTIVRFKRDLIEPKFFNYFSRSHSYFSQIEKLTTGATRQRISRSNLGKIVVPRPPLAEQERIVAILDDAFAGLATATANAQKNIENAHAIFESYLNSIFVKKGSDWLEKKLGDVVAGVYTGPFGSLLHKSDYVDGGTPIVNPINIIERAILPDAKKTLSADTVNRLRAYKLSQADIVVARRGEIGRCAVVRAEQAGWVCGTGCFFIRTGKEVNADFLSHLLRSVDYSKKLERIATGATMKNLSNTALQNFRISLPSLSEQYRLETAFSKISEETQRAVNAYKRKIVSLGTLRQSILIKAFLGELTSPPSRAIKQAAE